MEISSCKTTQIFSYHVNEHARMHSAPRWFRLTFLHVNDITVYECTHEESTSACSAAQSGNFLWLKALKNFDLCGTTPHQTMLVFSDPTHRASFNENLIRKGKRHLITVLQIWLKLEGSQIWCGCPCVGTIVHTCKLFTMDTERFLLLGVIGESTCIMSCRFL